MASAALENEIGHGNTGLVPWSAFSDVTEPVPELAWPNSITTYSAMRTDAQIASLLLAFTLPIRRYGWYVAVNGARDEVVEHVANDLNLPIEGEEPKPTGRRRDRFSHDRHLFHALLNLTYGFMMFEQVYRYDEGDRRFHEILQTGRSAPGARPFRVNRRYLLYPSPDDEDRGDAEELIGQAVPDRRHKPAKALASGSCSVRSEFRLEVDTTIDPSNSVPARAKINPPPTSGHRLSRPTIPTRRSHTLDSRVPPGGRAS